MKQFLLLCCILAITISVIGKNQLPVDDDLSSSGDGSGIDDTETEEEPEDTEAIEKWLLSVSKRMEDNSVSKDPKITSTTASPPSEAEKIMTFPTKPDFVLSEFGKAGLDISSEEALSSHPNIAHTEVNSKSIDHPKSFSFRFHEIEVAMNHPNSEHPHSKRNEEKILRYIYKILKHGKEFISGTGTASDINHHYHQHLENNAPSAPIISIPTPTQTTNEKLIVMNAKNKGTMAETGNETSTTLKSMVNNTQDEMGANSLPANAWK